MSRDEKRVVITACGVATPLGVGIDNLWDGLISRRSAVTPITSFDPGGLTSRIAAAIPAFRVPDYVPKGYRKSTKVMARDIEVAVVCAYEAVKSGGLKTKCLIERGEAAGEPDVQSDRFGANIGAGLICSDLPELAGALQTCGNPEDGAFSLEKWGREGMENLTPLWLLKFLPNMLGCHVTIVHDCQAPSNTITCGEASSHLAVGEAFRTVARGAADVCLCGGAESKVNPMGLLRQELIGRLVTEGNDDPGRACRPFDPRRDGMIAGEGGGLLLLEELEFARKRGARIYAEVAGFGAAANATTWSGPEASGEGIALAVRSALDDAGVRPEEVDLVCTFGTGCTAYDNAEIAGLRRIFGTRRGIPAVAIKGAIGNNGAGAGAIDLSVAALATYHNTLPPSANTEGADTGGLLRFVQDGPSDARINVTLSLSYALSGSQIAALVIRKFNA